VKFIIPIDNGDEKIDRVYAEISMIDSEGMEVSFLRTDESSVAANEKEELRATWHGSGFGEFYQARILLLSDEKSYDFSKGFRL
jgi:hypothetical protein